MSSQLKAVLIGAGGHAHYAHLPALSAIEDVTLAAVCDLDERRVAETAETFGIPARYTDYREMIDNEQPDAVFVVVLPQHAHDIASTAMEMGCSVFMEKPPGANLEQARQLASAAATHKVVTAVGFHQRFAPVTRQGLKRCREAGPVHTASVRFCKNYLGRPIPLGGDVHVLIYEFIHALDTLRFVCGGDVEHVASVVRKVEADYDNSFQALVRFSTGATGVLQCQWVCGRRFFDLEVHGRAISFSGDPMTEGRIYADDKVEPVEVFSAESLSGSTEPYRAHGSIDLDRHFLDCVRDGVETEVSFADAVKTMELVEAIQASAIG